MYQEIFEEEKYWFKNYYFGECSRQKCGRVHDYYLIYVFVDTNTWEGYIHPLHAINMAVRGLERIVALGRGFHLHRARKS
jgi:hypothetical protein